MFRLTHSLTGRGKAHTIENIQIELEGKNFDLIPMFLEKYLQKHYPNSSLKEVEKVIFLIFSSIWEKIFNFLILIDLHSFLSVDSWERQGKSFSWWKLSWIRKIWLGRDSWGIRNWKKEEKGSLDCSACCTFFIQISKWDIWNGPGSMGRKFKHCRLAECQEYWIDRKLSGNQKINK